MVQLHGEDIGGIEPVGEDEVAPSPIDANDGLSGTHAVGLAMRRTDEMFRRFARGGVMGTPAVFIHRTGELRIGQARIGATIRERGRIHGPLK